MTSVKRRAGNQQFHLVVSPRETIPNTGHVPAPDPPPARRKPDRRPTARPTAGTDETTGLNHCLPAPTGFNYCLPAQRALTDVAGIPQSTNKII